MSDYLGVLDPLGIYGSVEKAEAIAAEARKRLHRIDFVHLGPMVRMAFHDSATFERKDRSGGVNGSFRYEVQDPFNAGMPEAFAAVDALLHQLVADGYPITYADIIQLGGAVMVERAGGPHIPVKLGRRDIDQQDADFPDKIPDEDFGPIDLVANMESHGFDKKDIVALSGAHTVGQSKHHDPLGPMKACDGVPVNEADQSKFDNAYFKNLLAYRKGRFNSDSALVQDPEMLALVELYAKDQDAFFTDFRESYLKMGNIGVNMHPLASAAKPETA